MHLICYATLQDHMVKGSSEFMEGSSSLYVTTLSCLVAIGIVVVELCYLFVLCLIYHVAPHDHVFKGLCNFVGGSSS